MKKEFPIKYALLSAKESVYENGREYANHACYIVSKAFVEEQYQNKTNNGTIKTTYKVCFPHTVKDGRINYLRKDPESPLARDNEFIVSKLFDDYAEAKKEFDLLNLFVPLNKLNAYENIELEILELTKDLETDTEKNKDKQKIRENNEYGKRI